MSAEQERDATRNSGREPIPQEWALRLQLAAIAGNEPANSYLEIRSKRVAGRGMDQDFISVGELDRVGRSVINRGQMSDTYIGVAPRADRRGTADAVQRVWALWADVDGRDGLEALSNFRPLPSIFVRSGSDHSGHAYWPLSSSVPPAWAQRANRRLALALGADRNATDAARVLRPVGTYNHKHDPPQLVVCTRLELAVFTVDQVVGRLPDDRAYVQPPRPHAPRAAGLSHVLDGLARTVREAPGPPNGNRNNVLFWAACRLRERVDACEIDGAEGRAVLRDAALAAGLGEIETDRTLDSALDTRAAA